MKRIFTILALILNAIALSNCVNTDEQLDEDSTYLTSHYLDILNDYGFVEDMTENGVTLLRMFPFLGDEQIISNLFD
ncbi:MAG: hypothetical protein KJ971_01910 [Firmicutes bacterium]|nr:hypothetical protein [Bacillota bacterium]